MDIAAARLSEDQIDVYALVRPVRRLLALDVALRWVVRGLAAALFGIAVVTAVSRLSPWPNQNFAGGPLAWALAYAGAVLLWSIGEAWLHWPSIMAAVRRADRQLGLKNRLATAHEFRLEHGEIHQLQRAELRGRLRTIHLRDAATVRFPARDAIALAAAALLAAAAIFVPSLQATSSARQSRDLAVVHHAAAATQRLVQQTAHASPGKTSSRTQATDPVAQILRSLQSQLSAAPSSRAALKALSSAQNQLQNLQATGLQAKSSLQAVGRALASGPTSRVAKALQSGNSSATQQALQNLADQLGKMSAAQRASVAKALQRAANSAPAGLSQSLRQAAFDLSDHNPAAARRALANAAKQIAGAQAAAGSTQSAQQAAADVQKIQSDVADGVTDSSKQQSASTTSQSSLAAQAPAQGKGAPKAARPVAGTQGGKQGSGHKAGSAGSSSGARSGKSGAAAAVAGTAKQGSAAGPGAVAAGQSQSAAGTSASSSGGGSGRGSGSTGNSAGRQQGRLQSVYVPGTTLSGPGITESGPLGSTVDVGSPAYKRLISQYSATANAGLGRVALPPALQNAVRQYFDALQH